MHGSRLPYHPKVGAVDVGGVRPGAKPCKERIKGATGQSLDARGDLFRGRVRGLGGVAKAAHARVAAG